ncbi:MAG: formylglycine-generating enzyme family protein, partial [Candidatus Cloacimonetes bacterium]|nr:formylglycine-generating enzyme family protein [Candidatus Cloacimonadota bacterium]
IVATETSYLTEIDLEESSIYYWRLKEISKNWSEIRTFQTIALEEKIELTSPENDKKSDVVSELPTFSWERFGASDYYRIQVSKDQTFATILIDDVSDGKSFTIATANTLEYDTVYYWKVRSDLTNWSEPWAFRVTSGVPSSDPEDKEFYSVGEFAHKIDLTWKDKTITETFEIERADAEGGPFALIGTCKLNYNSFVDFNREENTTYWYRGRTLSAIDTSAYWTPISVTTSSFELQNDPEMISVTAGTFNMGSDTGDADESPIHEVTLTNNYEMGKYEITNAQFAEVMNLALAKGYIKITTEITYEAGEGYNENAQDQSDYIKDNGDCKVEFDDIQKQYVVEAGYENYPVFDISWYGAALYVNSLSFVKGLDPLYDFWDADVYGTSGYRLPTEAEWE